MIRIVIVGLLKDQQHCVERACKKDKVEVKLYFVEAGPRPHFPTSADWCIVSRFIKHRWWIVAKQKFGKRAIFQSSINGGKGVTAIIAKVKAIVRG